MPGGLRLAGEFPSATLATEPAHCRFRSSELGPLGGDTPRPHSGDEPGMSPPLRLGSPVVGVAAAGGGRSEVKLKTCRGIARRATNGVPLRRSPPSAAVYRCGWGRLWSRGPVTLATRRMRDTAVSGGVERKGSRADEPQASNFVSVPSEAAQQTQGGPKFLGTSLFLGSDQLRPASFWRAFSAAGDFGYLDRRSS